MSKKVFFKFSQSSQKNTCAGVTFLIKLQTGNLKLYFKRDFHTGLSCEFFQFCKNTYCEEHLQKAGSETPLPESFLSKVANVAAEDL